MALDMTASAVPDRPREKPHLFQRAGGRQRIPSHRRGRFRASIAWLPWFCSTASYRAWHCPCRSAHRDSSLTSAEESHG